MTQSQRLTDDITMDTDIDGNRYKRVHQKKLTNTKYIRVHAKIFPNPFRSRTFLSGSEPEHTQYEHI